MQSGMPSCCKGFMPQKMSCRIPRHFTVWTHDAMQYMMQYTIVHMSWTGVAPRRAISRKGASWAVGRGEGEAKGRRRAEMRGVMHGVVRKEGLEPSRPNGHEVLNLARLPIPPLSQADGYIRFEIREFPPLLTSRATNEQHASVLRREPSRRKNAVRACSCEGTARNPYAGRVLAKHARLPSRPRKMGICSFIETHAVCTQVLERTARSRSRTFWWPSRLQR